MLLAFFGDGKAMASHAKRCTLLTTSSLEWSGVVNVLALNAAKNQRTPLLHSFDMTPTQFFSELFLFSLHANLSYITFGITPTWDFTAGISFAIFICEKFSDRADLETWKGCIGTKKNISALGTNFLLYFNKQNLQKTFSVSSHKQCGKIYKCNI